MSAMATNLKTINAAYAGVVESANNLGATVEDSKVYKDQMAQVSTNLQKLNGVYGNLLAAMGQK